MEWKEFRPWFLGAGAVLIILTAAAYPDFALATIFFTIDLFVMLAAFSLRAALRDPAGRPSSAPEAPEPRDLTTGRRD
jgi:hypothetical protein